MRLALTGFLMVEKFGFPTVEQLRSLPCSARLLSRTRKLAQLLRRSLRLLLRELLEELPTDHLRRRWVSSAPTQQRFTLRTPPYQWRMFLVHLAMGSKLPCKFLITVGLVWE